MGLPPMDERRSTDRARVSIESFLRKTMPDGKVSIMEFRSVNLSPTGVFLSTEDLGVLDLDEEVELMVSGVADGEKTQYYEGRARVVRSARVFTEKDTLAESGFGLMFLEADKEFSAAVAARLAADSS
jgi:hypothetical protein